MYVCTVAQKQPEKIHVLFLYYDLFIDLGFVCGDVFSLSGTFECESSVFSAMQSLCRSSVV